MQRRITTILTLAALLLTLGLNALMASTTVAAPAYTITDLTPTALDARGIAINDAGQVVGTYQPTSATEYRSFLWQNGTLTNLPGTPTNSGLEVAAINATGQIAGASRFPGRDNHSAAYWHDNTVTELLPDKLAGSFASDINNAGQLVGSFPIESTAYARWHAFLWQNGTLTDLTTAWLPNQSGTDGMAVAKAINNNAQILLVATNLCCLHESKTALRATDGTLTTIAVQGASSTSGIDLNDKGEIVGSFTKGSDTRAFFYANGQVTELSTLGGTASSALGINASSQVVGSSKTTQGTSHAFLWQNGTMTDLNTLLPANSGWELTSANKINTSGQIVGTGTINGKAHAFLLTPPKPTAPALPPGSPQECFPDKTGKCMRSLFRDYWYAHGGLAINGYPISDEFVEILPDGNPYTVQYFERVRMEYHPETTNPAYLVQLGQFGRTLHPADPKVAQQPGQAFFDQTGHNVPADFFAYWTARGGLDQFGFPISEVITETLEDGKPYQVQYFERARFERHPENAAPYDILLGQFGRKILKTVMP